MHAGQGTDQAGDGLLEAGDHADHSINICFSTTNAWVSRLIRRVTSSDVSHALITFHSDAFRKVLVMEAVGKGYRMLPWRKWEASNRLVERYSLVPGVVAAEDQCRALEQMADHLGQAYDLKGVLGFFRLLFRRGRQRIRNRGQDPNRLFCSEAVALFLQRANIDGFDTPEDWSPERLLSFVHKHRNTKFVLEEKRA